MNNSQLRHAKKPAEPIRGEERSAIYHHMLTWICNKIPQGSLQGMTVHCHQELQAGICRPLQASCQGTSSQESVNKPSSKALGAFSCNSHLQTQAYPALLQISVLPKSRLGAVPGPKSRLGAVPDPKSRLGYVPDPKPCLEAVSNPISGLSLTPNPGSGLSQAPKPLSGSPPGAPAPRCAAAACRPERGTAGAHRTTETRKHGVTG
ncbi:uncharacterized protein LOC107213368 [Parus major]|uniref:uncharacterized protein LOC107213368 n=1 Tax=Parus major TaxID=9157 RepID=UPI0007713CDD|nr:uncharacterized protein LOC107213368 [Parus major]